MLASFIACSNPSFNPQELLPHSKQKKNTKKTNNIKLVREKDQLTYKDKHIRQISGLSSTIPKVKKAQNDTY